MKRENTTTDNAENNVLNENDLTLPMAEARRITALLC